MGRALTSHQCGPGSIPSIGVIWELSLFFQQKGFVFNVQAQAFDSLTEPLSSGVGHFCHMIKLIKYHVTKRPGRSPGAHITTS